MILAFTASRVLAGRNWQWMMDKFVEENSADLFVSGACVGGDQYLATQALKVWPGRDHKIIVPHDTSRVNLSWLEVVRRLENVEIDFMGYGTTYADRNRAIIKAKPDLLGAFPLHPEGDKRSRHSGTWMTVRFAREAGISIEPHVLLS